MMKTQEYAHLSYAEFYQTIVKPMEMAIPQEQRDLNTFSHTFGNIDGVRRCINCEIGSWNAWKSHC